jgi:DNA-binding NarL/FixJ family response regulator
MEISGKIKVVIADDHALFREMLRLAMRGEGSIKIVGEAANWQQTIDVISDLKPDIVLLDSTMPEMDSIKALPAIREKSLKTKALMMKANKNEAAIFSALKGGAKGYLSKDVSISDLIKAIKAVHIGELWVERKLMARFLDRETTADSKEEGRAGKPKKILTPREKEVLCILTTGCTNKEIAQALFISEKTVKSHLNSIFKKLNVTRRLQAILQAIEQGLS